MKLEYQFFHWHLEFPGAMKGGGFDVVLGNPPWERIKLQEQEWFAAHGRADIAGARTANIRGRLIEELKASDPDLYHAFLADRRRAEGESHLIRDTSCIDEETGERRGMFPLCGRGDVNTYSLFAELNRRLINPTGRVGCIVPSGIATDDTTKVFFQDVAEHASLASLYDFENRDAIFAGVHRSYKFALLTITGIESPSTNSSFVFFAHQVEELAEPDKRFTLSLDDLKLLNPNTRTCPVFRSSRDAELTKAIYRRVPVLMKEGPPAENPWGISFLRMLDMANDSGFFKTAKELHAGGSLLAGNTFCKGELVYLPLYEAKMTNIFDHRHGNIIGSENVEEMSGIAAEPPTSLQRVDPNYQAIPRYWVPKQAVESRMGKTEWSHKFFINFRDVARATDVRTAIHSVLPWVGVGHKAPLILPYNAKPGEQALLIGNLNAFIYDYVCRQKIGGASLSYFIVKQLPVLPPETYGQKCSWQASLTLAEWIKPRVLELTYTAWDMKPFAEDLGYTGDPFVWDDIRRTVIRAELDAAFFHLYGMSEADADYILETFPIVKAKDVERFGSYRTKKRILNFYRQMAAGEFASELDPLPGVPPKEHLFGPMEPSREEKISQAYEDTRNDASTEFVVCHPETNARYIRRIRELLPNLQEVDANWQLYGLRKKGALSHLEDSKTSHGDARLKPYEFAVEWAMRHQIDQHGQSFEHILCDPDLRSQFDASVRKLKTGLEAFDVFDFRWLAVTIRKRIRNKAPISPSLFDDLIPLGRAEDILPEQPGVYLIQGADRTKLYTGWADNLKQSFQRILIAGDGEIIPNWLLSGHCPAKTIAFCAFPPGTPDGPLHEQWRANLRGSRPILNLLDEAA